MQYKLTPEQLDELRQAVDANDIGRITALFDAAYHHRRRLEREAAEQCKRLQRRCSPWIPESR